MFVRWDWATSLPGPNGGAFGVDGVVTLKWALPVDSVGRPIDPTSTADRKAVDSAEAAIRARDGNGALRALEQTERPGGSYARRLYLKAAQMTERWDLVVSETGNPESVDELVLLVRAFEQRGLVGRTTGGAHASLEPGRINGPGPP